MALCYQQGIKFDFQDAKMGQIQEVIKRTYLESAPNTTLVKKSGVLKRDPGMFAYWTESTVLLTRDNFLHVYPWKDNTILSSKKRQSNQMTDISKRDKGKSE